MASPVFAQLLAGPFLAVEFEFLRSPSVRIVAWVIGLVLVLTVAWGASVICDKVKRHKRSRRDSAGRKPQSVFDEICDAQGLSEDQKQRLLAGAEILELHSPSLLFIDSGLLNRLASSDDESAAEFEELAARLFPSGHAPVESDLIQTAGEPVTV